MGAEIVDSVYEGERRACRGDRLRYLALRLGSGRYAGGLSEATRCGTRFQTPITDISDLAGKPPGSFFFAYVDGPDHALIELNTASHHRFGHIHLLSDDPVSAGEWYKKYFGVTGYIGPRRPRIYRGVHVEPMASLQMDNVNIIIFPVEYARDAMPELWKDRKTFEPTKGRVVDHLAFSVDNLHRDAGAPAPRRRQSH